MVENIPVFAALGAKATKEKGGKAILYLRNIKAVIFDYGNTLIEFGPKQVVILNDILLSHIREWYGPCDETHFTEIRKRQILAPYDTEEFIENDRDGICVELLRELYGVVPDAARIAEMLRIKHDSFVDAVKLPGFVPPLLKQLRRTCRLGFISNYPCRTSIVDSLEKIGILDFFDSIVVSGEIGVVKPHPRIFRCSLDQLALAPENCLYVGDNWLADIQGAKRIGMSAIHTTQYVSYENFTPFDGDLQPDKVISHLNQIERQLKSI
ncbi:MAG: HAD family hydrolase [Victivallales bacterium]|nr:HAD family hydrolase [Victivallales bacterium]